MRKIASIALISLFMGAFVLPLFATVDECEMSCCLETTPCCDIEKMDLKCPTMTQGQTMSPLLIPMAPRPVKTELLSFLSISEIHITNTDSNEHVGWIINSQDSPLGFYSKIPHYLLIHSLLI